MARQRDSNTKSVDLVKQLRKQHLQVNRIRIKLEQAEKSGFTNDRKQQILAQSKEVKR